MDLDFAVLADGVSPRPDGKLDLYGAGFDTIFAASIPAQHARLFLVVRVLVSRHEAEHPHRLDIVLQAADGEELARAQGELGALEEEQRSQIPAGRQAGLAMVLAFENLVFPNYETYQLAIHWDGNEARAPIRLFVAPPPQPES